jgi:2-phosphosulfolactate phosphatase
MTIRRVRLHSAETADGIVLVIDVIRAFTVAAYALDRGADRLWLVRTTEDALTLRCARPDALLAGETRGRLITGFDLNNSPAAMARVEVAGRTIIQRTGAGTQGAVLAERARHLFVCSLANARATAEAACRLHAETGEPITLLPTCDGDDPSAIEDDICADYLEALFHGHTDAGAVLSGGIARLRASDRLDVFRAGDRDFPPEDVDAFLAVDRFAFAMPGARRERDGVRYVEVTRRD